MNEQNTNLVMVILAIGAIVVPVVGMAMLFKLTTYFVSKGEFESMKSQNKAQHEENRQRFQTIEDDVKTLLSR